LRAGWIRGGRGGKNSLGGRRVRRDAGGVGGFCVWKL
jgi:hypothetical protein